MRSRIVFWLLGIGCVAPPAWACSFAFTGLPYDAGNYVFYGRVLAHISHRMDVCGNDPRWRGDQCKPAWGWKLEVIEPVHMPRKLTKVEYFEYTVDPACGAMPLGEAHVRRIPVGSLVTLVASPHWASDPKAAAPRLSSPLPAHGLIAMLPEGSDPQAMSRRDAERSDLACLSGARWPHGKLAFEYWRERHALASETTPRGKLERLIRLMSVFDARLFARAEQPTYLEEVVRQELPPELLDEFYSQLPAARESAHAACGKD